jgi:hypothetical protein
MENLNETREPLLPENEPAPDALFGECEGFDVDSILSRMFPDGIKFFDLPLLERFHRRQYHLVRLRGSFRLAKLVRDYRPQLLRSESCQNARGKTHIDRLMFSLEAQRLAEAKQLTLVDQPDYSLGEIYCGAVSGPVFNADRQVGFAQ